METWENLGKFASGCFGYRGDGFRYTLMELALE
jgi:hypothetical protein